MQLLVGRNPAKEIQSLNVLKIACNLEISLETIFDGVLHLLIGFPAYF